MRQGRIRLISMFLAIFIMLCLAWFAYQGRSTIVVVYLGLFLVLFLLGWSIYIPQFLLLLSRIKEGKDIHTEHAFYNVLLYLIILSSSIFLLCSLIFSDKIIMNFGNTVLILIILASVLTPMLGVLIFTLMKQIMPKCKNRPENTSTRLPQ